jgi:hypothetical protein
MSKEAHCIRLKRSSDYRYVILIRTIIVIITVTCSIKCTVLVLLHAPAHSYGR